jgi:hypothetical protein
MNFCTRRNVDALGRYIPALSEDLQVEESSRKNRESQDSDDTPYAKEQAWLSAFGHARACDRDVIYYCVKGRDDERRNRHKVDKVCEVAHQQ